MSENPAPRFYTVESGIAFADALAAGIWERCGRDQAALSKVRVLLPTRRACRNLREAFLRLRNGAPTLLPRMQPLGDIDTEELSFELTDPALAEEVLTLPPAMTPLRRQILLARAVMAMKDYIIGPAQAIALAQDLARLMDQIYTQGLDLSDMASLVPEAFSAHWQVTLEFLKILSERWPDILSEQGVMDAADRRDRLLRILAKHWQENPPSDPVYAAGSTGSIPATRELLHVIAQMPEGCVILPGLDTQIEEESWVKLSETHPQFMLKQLLSGDKNRVESWQYNPGKEKPSVPPALSEALRKARTVLAREMMRPAETSAAWRDLQVSLSEKSRADIADSLKAVKLLECDTLQDEAQSIALIFRETLETDGKTAALITPDRQLARRVAMACARWGIAVNDSGGQALPETPVGGYLQLILSACSSGLGPSAFISLLKHKCAAIDSGDVQALEITLLRGPRPAPGFGPLRERLENVKDYKDLSRFLDRLEELFSPLLFLMEGDEQSFTTFLDAHIEMAEALAGDHLESGAARLWTGEDGEAAALFLAGLREQADVLPRVRGEDYAAMISQLMRSEVVRPAYGTHSRLSILGQLEARLIQANVMILGGLNEGTWPPDPGNDPWMSRPMRAEYGLPSPEQGIGQAAHDFAEGFCAPEVYLTRSHRVDGSPTVPARWLARLKTVLEALNIDPGTLESSHIPLCREVLDDPGCAPEPLGRAGFAPPVAVRPRKLSVTWIEKWMRDPYSVYAAKILNLYKLPPLEESADAAIRGTIIHDVLDDFIKEHKASLPENALEVLLESGKKAIARELVEPQARDFWWPRFVRLAEWFIAHERQWREGARPLETEVEGTISLETGGGAFTLTAKADRIDRLQDNTCAVIDYKTGQPPGMGEVRSGLAPQLPLEALIASEGGFEAIPAADVGYLGFWRMSGGAAAGEEKKISPAKDESFADMTEVARNGLLALINVYDQPDTAYISLPRPDYAPPAAYQDYAHLARVQEWADLGEEDGA